MPPLRGGRAPTENKAGRAQSSGVDPRSPWAILVIDSLFFSRVTVSALGYLVYINNPAAGREGNDMYEQSAECTQLTGHLPGADHRTQECPTYADDIEG